jgi:hypothetical protein
VFGVFVCVCCVVVVVVVGGGGATFLTGEQGLLSTVQCVCQARELEAFAHTYAQK